MLDDIATDLDRLSRTLRTFEAQKALTKVEASHIAAHLAAMCRAIDGRLSELDRKAHDSHVLLYDIHKSLHR